MSIRPVGTYIEKGSQTVDTIDQKQIQEIIAGIDVNQIDGVAQKIIEKILDVYGVDPRQDHFTARVAFTERDGGKELVGYELAPDEAWKPSPARIGLSTLLLPLVKNELTQSFSTPGAFLEKGHRFLLTQDIKPYGILEKVAAQTDLSRCRFFQFFNIKLSVNLKYSPDLYFSIDWYGVGRDQYDIALGNDGFSLSDLK